MDAESAHYPTAGRHSQKAPTATPSRGSAYPGGREYRRTAVFSIRDQGEVKVVEQCEVGQMYSRSSRKLLALVWANAN